MTVQDAVNQHREENLRIAAKHGATRVRIFGSVARVAAGPDSDLDLLADVTSKTSPWLPASLIVDPEDLLDVTVDVTTSKSLHREIRDRLLAEARPL